MSHICGYTVRLIDPDETLVCHIDKDQKHSEYHQDGAKIFRYLGDGSVEVGEIVLVSIEFVTDPED